MGPSYAVLEGSRKPETASTLNSFKHLRKRLAFPSHGGLLGCLGGLLGRLGVIFGVLERSLGVSGASWAVLGAFWNPLGLSWGPLGPSRPPLGRESGGIKKCAPMVAHWAGRGPRGGVLICVCIYIHIYIYPPPCLWHEVECPKAHSCAAVLLLLQPGARVVVS